MAIIKIRNPAIDLDAAEIPNLDASKITSGSFGTDRIPNLAASKITSGTFSDSRISASSVSQHATSFDDNKIVNDISTLGLRVHTQENLNASNTNSASFDVFQDSSGITSLTNSARNASEYVSSTTTSNTNTVITLNSSNYATYLGESSLIKTTSSGTARTGNDRFNPELASNQTMNSSSGLAANAVPNSTQEATLMGYYFGSSGTDTQFLIDNYDTSNTYRVTHSNMRFKEGITFSPTNGQNYTFRWRNGQNTLHSSQGIVLWGLTDGGTGDNDYSPTGVGQMGTVTNGTTYNVAITNSSGTFFDGITFRVFHTSGNSYMFDSLSIPGTVNAPTEVVSATGSFEGVAITAASTSSMGAVITYQDNAGTNALNTDIILKLSADNGSNYSTATLTALPDFATGIKMAKVNDLSVTAGTQLKYKLEFANQASGSKEARIRGVSLQY